jgi:regulatory protein
MREKPQRGGPATAPDEASLHDAALAHLARYATTRAGLQRVLERRVDRWARAAADTAESEAVAAQADAARLAVQQVVSRLAATGAVSDAAFAESRARSLVRAGRSRQAVAAHLAAKGVDRDLARATVPEDPETELAAALALARRRRIGPFRAGDAPDVAGRLRELAMLARAGFPRAVATRALAMEPEEAEALVIALRRG